MQPKRGNTGPAFPKHTLKGFRFMPKQPALKVFKQAQIDTNLGTVQVQTTSPVKPTWPTIGSWILLQLRNPILAR